MEEKPNVTVEEGSLVSLPAPPSRSFSAKFWAFSKQRRLDNTANHGQSDTQFLIASTLIWCAFRTALQVSRTRIFKAKYYFGTGMVSVTGASFAIISIALFFFAQSYANGVKLAYPEAVGVFMGTCCLCRLIAVAMAFIPPRAIWKLFPPLIVGVMLTLIRASLVKSGITNWGRQRLRLMRHLSPTHGQWPVRISCSGRYARRLNLSHSR
ncbi:uncharacterized protein UBRO_20119 [Ustilago bromivora]|uniref:Uncharacterized protein n=1 Tax=Ustilago bromivora TaxID=307758 RepID=A0A1K0HI14_9BASI|nr:uncharacterized protein UBRO_20119 [Ustilago bromivora]SYW75994.1 uncharacterized protein UBRO2_01149 [Ustilago bromivora]